jgi:hypothetical protein
MLQVKANQNASSYWLLNEGARRFWSRNLYYAFVDLRINADEPPKFWIVPSRYVSQHVHVEQRKQGKWYSWNREARFQGKWDTLG